MYTLTPHTCSLLMYIPYTIRGVGTDLEKGYGEEGYGRHPFHASPVVCKRPISSKSLKNSVHKTPFEKNLEILASTFAQILALKPPNLEIFSSQDPPLSEAKIRSQAPTLWKSGLHTLPEKS